MPIAAIIFAITAMIIGIPGVQLLGSHLELPPRHAYVRAAGMNDIGIMIFVLQ